MQKLFKKMPKPIVSNQQIHFLEKIQDVLSPNTTLAAELCEKLNCSADSAYRRIRGETLLSIDELIILCNTFNVSFDAFSKKEENIVSFSYKGIENKTNGLLDYLKEVEQDLIKISSIGNSKIVYACQDIPVFYHYNFPKLAAFKFFYWMRSIMNAEELENKKYQPELIQEEIFTLAKKIFGLYKKVNSTEIWTTSTIQSTLKQIDFYWESGIFNSPEEAIEICNDLEEEIKCLQKQCELNTKFIDTPEHKNFAFYYSEIEITNNCVWIDLGIKQAVYLSHFSFYTMKTLNDSYAKKTEVWLESLIKKTTLISGVAEKTRFQFFNTMYKQIQQLKTKIHG